MKKAFLILFSVFTFYTLAGQEARPPQNSLSLAARAHYGFIIPHSRAIKEISDSNPWGVEGEFAWHLMRENIWRYCYCFPRTGFSLMYMNFDNPEILGYSLSLVPFIEPYIRADKKLNFSLRFGMGPSFVNRVYDEESNPDNFFFSSHISFLILLNFGINYRIDPQWTARVAFNYNHISNGGISLPNTGMNFPSLNVGADYRFQNTCCPDYSKEAGRDLYKDRNWINVYLLGTAKNAEKGEEKWWPVYGAGAYYSHLVARILAVSVGTEWISDHAVKENLRRMYEDLPEDPPDHNRAALLAGIEVLFGRFTFIQQFGLYYYAPNPARNLIYQRYGLNFRWTDRLYTGINIKAHGHVADLMDFRLGMVF